jgi:hypothetical protein
MPITPSGVAMPPALSAANLPFPSTNGSLQERDQRIKRPFVGGSRQCGISYSGGKENGGFVID